jgi:hypothetical protein
LSTRDCLKCVLCMRSDMPVYSLLWLLVNPYV